MVLKYHPDVNQSTPAAEKMIRDINAAYKLLCPVVKTVAAPTQAAPTYRNVRPVRHWRGNEDEALLKDFEEAFKASQPKKNAWVKPKSTT